MNYKKLTGEKLELDTFRPLPHALVTNLEQWFLVELTYSSNAIEGNTLTRSETAMVIEKGLTVGGKTLVEHLEATNHAEALKCVEKLAQSKTKQLKQSDLLSIHNLILQGIDNNNAGHYRNVPVRISGSQVVLPNARKVPDLMNDFMAWLTTEKKLHPVELAAEAHYRFVRIHPFIDGNGRTVRLLMNLILMQHGYPPAIIRKRDRQKYLNSLEKIQLGGSNSDYQNIIFKATERSLDIYLKAVKDENEDLVQEPEVAYDSSSSLLRIGKLSKQSSESTATIRYWTKEGLLEINAKTESGYQLYSPDMLERIKEIRSLQNQRFTLREIKEKFN